MHLPLASRSFMGAIYILTFSISVAHLNLGLCYAALGDKKEALNIQKSLLAIDDDGLKDPKSHKITQISAMLNVAKLYLEFGNPAEALRYLLKAKQSCQIVKYDNEQGIFTAMGEAYQALNKNEEAEFWYRAALSLSPGQVPTYLRFGKMLSKNVSKQRRLNFVLPQALKN